MTSSNSTSVTPSVSLIQSEKDSQFLEAVAQGDMNSTLDHLIDGADINAKNSDDQMALTVAAALLNMPEIKLNQQDLQGNTALMQGTVKGHFEIVDILLSSFGISLNNRNQDGRTALELV
jgi:ankyrin repeat protein